MSLMSLTSPLNLVLYSYNVSRGQECFISDQEHFVVWSKDSFACGGINEIFNFEFRQLRFIKRDLFYRESLRCHYCQIAAAPPEEAPDKSKSYSNDLGMIDETHFRQIC